MGILFVEKIIFFSGGAIVLGLNNLWSTPPSKKKSTIKITLREFSSMPKSVVLHRHMMVQVEYYSHCTSPENGVETEYDMKTDTQTNPCIPDAGWTGICQQTWNAGTSTEVSSRFCTLHLSGAGWFRLPCGVLPAVLGVTIPDGPISAAHCPQVALELKWCCSQLLPWVHPSHPALCWSWWEANSSNGFPGSNIPNILIRMELNLSHWPLVCGWYGLVHIFMHPHQLVGVSHQLTLKVMTLIWPNLFR